MASVIPLDPPGSCQSSNDSSFRGGFICGFTDVGLGLYDTQLAPCELVRFTGFSPIGKVSFYLFPDSTQAGKWTSYSSLTPRSAGATVLDGCSKTTLCTVLYRPTADSTGAVYLQSRSSGDEAAKNITHTDRYSASGSMPDSPTTL